MAQLPAVRDRSRARGRETRRRIVAAAYHLMSSRGYEQTTMAEIAAAAGVALPTVYFNFRSKPGLFVEAYRLAIKGEQDVEPADRTWFAEMKQEPDVRKALELAVSGTTEILQRVTPLVSAMHGLSGDPELSDFYRYSEGLRRAGYQLVIDILIQKRPLRESLIPNDATSIFLVLAGPEVYRSFVIEEGWSEDRWREWTTGMILTALFGP